MSCDPATSQLKTCSLRAKLYRQGAHRRACVKVLEGGHPVASAGTWVGERGSVRAMDHGEAVQTKTGMVPFTILNIF